MPFAQHEAPGSLLTEWHALAREWLRAAPAARVSFVACVGSFLSQLANESDGRRTRYAATEFCCYVESHGLQNRDVEWRVALRRAAWSNNCIGYEPTFVTNRHPADTVCFKLKACDPKDRRREDSEDQEEEEEGEEAEAEDDDVKSVRFVLVSVVATIHKDSL